MRAERKERAREGGRGVFERKTGEKEEGVAQKERTERERK